MELSQSQQEELLEHLRNGLTRSAAAYALDLTRLDVCDFIDADDEFRHRVEDAEAEAGEHVTEAIFQAAVSGSVSAARLWMSMRSSRPSTDLVPIDEQDDMDAELAELNRLAQ